MPSEAGPGIGHGTIDFAAVFDAMLRLGYTGDICLDTPEAAGRESRDVLVPLMGAAGIAVD